MFSESLQKNIKGKLIQHPKISFVYYRGKEFSCLQHPELSHMNRGAIKQHIQGKKHRLDFETGKPLRVSEKTPYLAEQAKEWPNQKSTIMSADNVHFWEFKDQLDAIFQIKDPEIVFSSFEILF